MDSLEIGMQPGFQVLGMSCTGHHSAACIMRLS